MSIGNKHVSHYKFFKPLPQKKRIAESIHMPNATAEEIFQTQKINIKTLESKVVELENQIKECKLENRNLRKANTLQEKELRKTNESSTGISSLMRSYKEEIRATQSKASSLQDQLRISENNLKTQEKALSRKILQVEKLITAKRQNERRVKELSLENAELKSEKGRIDKEWKKVLQLSQELQLKNEELHKTLEQMTSQSAELEDCLQTAENHKVKLEKDFKKLQKCYDELEQNFSLPKPCPVLVVAETQTEGINNESNLCLTSNADSNGFSKICELNKDVLKSDGDHRVDNGEYFKAKRIQEENTSSSSHSIYKTKFSGLNDYQNGLVTCLHKPKFQKSLLKPMKSRTLCSLKPQCDEAEFRPVDSPYPIKPLASISNIAVSPNFLQSNYSTKNAQAVQYLSRKLF